MASCLLSNRAHAIPIPKGKGLEPTEGKIRATIASPPKVPSPLIQSSPQKKDNVYLYFSVKLTIYPHFLLMSHLCSLLKKKNKLRPEALQN